MGRPAELCRQGQPQRPQGRNRRAGRCPALFGPPESPAGRRQRRRCQNSQPRAGGFDQRQHKAAQRLQPGRGGRAPRQKSAQQQRRAEHPQQAVHTGAGKIAGVDQQRAKGRQYRRDRRAQRPPRRRHRPEGDQQQRRRQQGVGVQGHVLPETAPAGLQQHHLPQRGGGRVAFEAVGTGGNGVQGVGLKHPLGRPAPVGKVVPVGKPVPPAQPPVQRPKQHKQRRALPQRPPAGPAAQHRQHAAGGSQPGQQAQPGGAARQRQRIPGGDQPQQGQGQALLHGAAGQRADARAGAQQKEQQQKGGHGACPPFGAAGANTHRRCTA